MKKTLSIIAMAAFVALAWSCKKEDPSPTPDPGPDPDPTPTEETIDEISATLAASPLKTTWADGDSFIVYAASSEGDDYAEYVIAEGAGTATGKFKPAIKGLKKGADKGYFASYPYDEDMTFAQHNTFSFTIVAEQTGNCPVFASSTDGATLDFKSPLAGLEIKLTGKGNASRIVLEDKDNRNILNGNATINPKTGKLNITNGAASKNSVAKTFEKTTLSDQASSFFFDIPATALATGATIVVYNASNGEIGSVEIPATTLTAGQLSTVGPLSLEASSSVADLSAIESANCYIISEPGEYKFKCVKGNTPDGVGAPATAEILWETYGNSEEVTPNSVIATVSYANDYITFKTPETLKPGNALVAAKDASGNILWSWHLWVTTNEIAATDLGFGDGSQMMNYNLGATGACGTTESFGLLYQWGRKDPFIGGGVLGSSTPATIAGVEMDTTPEQGTVDEDFANAHPTTFVIVAGSDGQKDWLAPSDGTRWSTTKGKDDPCPAGWRVPAEEDAPNFFSADLQITCSYGEETSTYSFFVNKTYELPLGGSRNYTDGSYTKSDSKFFSCSGADGEYGKALRINGGGSPAWGIRRKAEACAIRCVADVVVE